MALVEHTRARFDFEILGTIEAGLELFGTEVKSLRKGQGKLEGAHVVVRGGEAFLVGAHIPPFQPKNVANDYDPERSRRLLVTHEQLVTMLKYSEAKGLTVVPLSVYNKGRNLKLSIGIARGKKKYDKRETLKKRDTARAIERRLKDQ